MYSDLSWHGIYGSSSSFAVHALQGQKSLRESRLAQPAVPILAHDRHFEITHDVKSFFLDVDSGRNPDEDPDNRKIGQSRNENSSRFKWGYRIPPVVLTHPVVNWLFQLWDRVSIIYPPPPPRVQLVF
jgi:hypothetical protein